MNETIQPTLALSDTFFDSFGRAPRPLQKKLLAFISKFRQNPSSSGLNYEKIQDSASPGYRSARLDNDYRVIINQPSNGNVYLILWAGKHDEAYKWAKTHACRINPTTGSMQLYEVPVVATAQNLQPQSPGLQNLPAPSLVLRRITPALPFSPSTLTPTSLASECRRSVCRSCAPSRTGRSLRQSAPICPPSPSNRLCGSRTANRSKR